MKWILLLLISVMGYVGFVQHTQNEQSITETTQELLLDMGYGNVGIDGINLPISYTFLSEKVVSKIFFKKNGNSQSIDVTVTPMGSFPIISIFRPPSYQVEFNPFD